jgi:hypothetical protein
MDNIDGSGSSLEVITGQRVTQGLSEFRMYAMQGLSGVPDVHRDWTAFWLSEARAKLNLCRWPEIHATARMIPNLKSSSTVALYAGKIKSIQPSNNKRLSGCANLPAPIYSTVKNGSGFGGGNIRVSGLMGCVLKRPEDAPVMDQYGTSFVHCRIRGQTWHL